MAKRHLALLRGINVGGKNVIRMVDLRACFEAMGLEDVGTYIQSGNVLFDGGRAARGTLTRRIEAGLAARFDYAATVVVRTRAELQGTVHQAPEGFGTAPDAFRYDVAFLKEPLTAAEALREVDPREGVDLAWPGKRVLYFSRRIAKASQSRLSRLAQKPIYAALTIRNWNTTTKLLALMGGD